MSELPFWMVPRPKRRLTSVPRILSTWVLSARQLELDAHDEVWKGNRERHIRFEESLEQEELKRLGKRRDAGGSGGRTYAAMLKALGLIFSREEDGRAFLTLAGEALVDSDTSPTRVLTTQIARFQYPSAYSISRGVNISRSFKVRPLLLILQLLMDDRVDYLTEYEIGRHLAFYGISNSAKTVDSLVSRVVAERSTLQSGPIGTIDLGEGPKLAVDPPKSTKHAPPTQRENKAITNANVLVNWLDFTQLIDREGTSVWVPQHHRADVANLLEKYLEEPLVKKPEDEEYFQRRYGRGPDRTKDTRDLDRQAVVTAWRVEEALLRTRYLALAEKSPVTEISTELVNDLADSSGVPADQAETFLKREFPRGSFNVFVSEYIQMAYESRGRATEFELATAELLGKTFGFNAEHTGISGRREPDVVIRESNEWGLFDNKAYRAYSLSSSDERAMLEYLKRYSQRAEEAGASVAFYAYIAAGFKRGVEDKIAKITAATGVPGSAIDVETMARLAEMVKESAVPRNKLMALFGCGRQVTLADLSLLAS